MSDSRPVVPDERAAPAIPDMSGRQSPLSGWFLLCVYCRRPVPVESFTYRSSIHRLVGAVCPHCRRRTTVRATTWLEAFSRAQAAGLKLRVPTFGDE